MREMVCKITAEIQKPLGGRSTTCLSVIRMLANEGRLSMNEILKLDNVEKYYGNKANLTKAVDKISFSVEKGEFVGIMGASGSGKTTLLNCISTIDRVTAGHIYVGDKDITTIRGNELNKFRREELGFIFQDFNLLDTLTGYQMSGGQKQRVAAARALITNPKLILADEPTGALDSKSSRYLLESMKEMNEGLAATILMVTHDAFTASYASRVIFIKDGKIFNEIRRGDDTRKQFFNRIIEVVTVLGGSLNDAL